LANNFQKILDQLTYWLLVKLKELLIIEDQVSDVVVGQIQRDMRFVKTEIAEENQKVNGITLGLQDELMLKRALPVTQNFDFFNYQVSFKLF
jgi:restriction system protein